MTDKCSQSPTAAGRETLCPIINDTKNTMTYQQNISYFRIFYSDFIVTTFSLLLFMVFGTMGSIIVTGSREEGMVYGLIGGLALGLITFYYLRGQFNFIWTAMQLIINAGMTVGQFLGVSYLLNDTGIAEISYGYVLIFISVPTLISINKQLLDSLTKKLKAEKRTKEPIRIL